MKYLFIFLLSFVLFTPALAVRQIPGNVPVVEPLQPVPAGGQPNIQKNVQASQNPEENSQAQPDAFQSPGSETGASSPTSTQAASRHSGAASQVFLILCLIAAAVVVVVAIRQRHAK